MARPSSISKLQTRSLVRENSKKNPQMSKENFKGKEKFVTGPNGGLTLGQTGRLTVGRKITLTLEPNTGTRNISG
jgi:hypothetical protein